MTITNLDELFDFIKDLITSKDNKIKMGVDGNIVRFAKGEELLEILERVMNSAELLIQNKTVILEDGLDESERHALFVVNGLRNKELAQVVADIIMNASDIEQLVKEFKAKKEELETELAEKEIGTMDTQEFERVFPAKPYADDMPEKPRPIDKVVKRRWDKRKPA